jgi:hypothetical protein
VRCLRSSLSTRPDTLRSSISEKLPFTSGWKWISVLKVAHRFDFASVRALAVRQLTPLTTPVDKIVLAREYGVREWLEGAYRDVCVSPSLPSDAETFKKIARARDTLSMFAPTADYDVRRVVQDVFQLEIGGPEAAEPATPFHQDISRFVEPMD